LHLIFLVLDMLLFLFFFIFTATLFQWEQVIATW
tara:strand:- start:317 stop:418 length:102 start_codon:yes stop_codon:yes gene_type:complete